MKFQWKVNCLAAHDFIMTETVFLHFNSALIDSKTVFSDNPDQAMGHLESYLRSQARENRVHSV